MDIFGPNFGPIPAQSKLANFGSILLCDTANMGFLWVANSIMILLDHFIHVLYPFPCTILFFLFSIFLHFEKKQIT